VNVVVSGLFLDRLALVLQYGIVNYVYDHLPFFSRDGPPVYETFKSNLSEFRELTVNSHLILAGLLVAKLSDANESRAMKTWSFQHEWKTFSFLAFSAKLAMARTVVDIAFYVGHRVMHMPKYYYIHKRHHEHNNPHVLTNQHFTQLDVFLEAYIPMIIALVFLKTQGVYVSPLEENLISVYIGWLEQASHAGDALTRGKGRGGGGGEGGFP
jgi:sterol desaturase/sphingolipid hydroxylase (fatty acid hydroxylase superfamily)